MHSHNPPGASPIALLTRRAATRAMTAGEMEMARALSCCRGLRGSRYRSTITALHASALSDKPTISDDLASILRAGVKAMAAQLPARIVELAGGAV